MKIKEALIAFGGGIVFLGTIILSFILRRPNTRKDPDIALEKRLEKEAKAKEKAERKAHEKFEKAKKRAEEKEKELQNSHNQRKEDMSDLFKPKG